MPKRGKTTKPVGGQEQPLSIALAEVSTWTELDVSAAFPARGESEGIIVDVALGIDHVSNSTQGFAEIRFRKKGDTTDFHDAIGMAGQTDFMYFDENEDFVKGGLTGTFEIPVDSTGKFEYQLRNDGHTPRSLLRIIEVLTIFDLPDVFHELHPIAATLPDSAYPLYSKLVASTYDQMVLIYSDTESQSATWTLPNVRFDADTDFVQFVVTYIPFAGSNGDNIKWDFGFYGAGNSDVWDGTLATGTVTDTKITSSDIHVITKFVTGAEAEFLNRDSTVFKLSRDITVGSNLAAPVYFLHATVEVFV